MQYTANFPKHSNKQRAANSHGNALQSPTDMQWDMVTNPCSHTNHDFWQVSSLPEGRSILKKRESTVSSTSPASKDELLLVE